MVSCVDLSAVQVTVRLDVSGIQTEVLAVPINRLMDVRIQSRAVQGRASIPTRPMDRRQTVVILEPFAYQMEAAAEESRVVMFVVQVDGAVHGVLQETVRWREDAPKISSVRSEPSSARVAPEIIAVSLIRSAVLTVHARFLASPPIHPSVRQSLLLHLPAGCRSKLSIGVFPLSRGYLPQERTREYGFEVRLNAAIGG
jgi:hypothetical protein